MAEKASELTALVVQFRHLAQNVLMRYKSNPNYASEIFHTEDVYRDLLRLCDLAAAPPAPACPVELREALAELFELVESGELVRDISRDGQADWHMRMLKMTMTLKKAQMALVGPAPQQSAASTTEAK